MARTVIRRGHRKACIGDLRDRIVLQTRKIKEPEFGSAEFAEDFVQEDEVWASIKTLSGKVFFDGVGTDLLITHEVLIRYDPTVTAETWIKFRGRRFDVAQVENLEERKEYLRLLCIDRGDQEASEA